MIKTVELFAGVGGFRLGLEKASSDFDFVWMNQWEPGKKAQHAFNCYVAHFGASPKHVNEDIAKVKHLVPKHDLLVGGFPCQDYSVARSNAMGIQGKKGVLWWEIFWILKHHRPLYVLLENVDRLLRSPSSQRGRDFAIMLRCFYELNYYVEWRIINAADYGNAQRRRRVFIFATHRETSWCSKLNEWTPEEILKSKGFFPPAFRVDEIGEIKSYLIDGGFYTDLLGISSLFSADFKKSGYSIDGVIHTAEPVLENSDYRTLRSVLDGHNVDERFFIGDNLEEWIYLKGAKKAPRRKPNGEEYFYTEGPIPFPDNLDMPSRTMLTSEASKNRSTHIVRDPGTGRLRFLTPTECERLNGFPDGWTNTGMPESWRYFTMGNALVVPLISRMGSRLEDIHAFEDKAKIRER